MTTQEWENDLLMEREGLTHLHSLFQGVDNLLEETIDEYGSYFDPALVMLVEMIRYDLNITLNGVVALESGENIPGILKQLEVVSDECQTLQAGLKNKEGIPDEE